MPKDTNAMQMTTAFSNMIENMASSGNSGFTKLDQGTYDDRYSPHTFTYLPDYITGGIGQPKGTPGGPDF